MGSRYAIFKLVPCLLSKADSARADSPGPGNFDFLQLMLNAHCAFQVEFPSDHGGGCPHSYPFITGDTFRAFADVAFDNTERLYRPGYHKYFVWHDACCLIGR